MQKPIFYRNDDVSNPKRKIRKPSVQKTVTKYQESNELGQKEVHHDVPKFQMQAGKPLAQSTSITLLQGQSEIRKQEAHVDVSNFKLPKKKLLDPIISVFQSQEHGEIRYEEGINDFSRLMVPKRKLLTPTTSVAQFQEDNNIGPLKVHADVSKFKSTEKKLFSPTTCPPEFQIHNDNGDQKARGGILKLKTRGGILKLEAPENKILAGTSVAQFQEYCGIGRLEAGEDIWKSKLQTSKMLAQRTHVAQVQAAQVQAHTEIGQPEAHNFVSKSKLQRSKMLAQTTHVAQLQSHNEIGHEEAVCMPKISKENRKIGNSIKRFDSPGSSSNGLPENSKLTKSVKKYRDLMHKYLKLEEESSILDDRLKKTESEVKRLEKVKYALLDELVVFEGLVDPPSSKYPNQKL